MLVCFLTFNFILKSLDSIEIRKILFVSINMDAMPIQLIMNVSLWKKYGIFLHSNTFMKCHSVDLLKSTQLPYYRLSDMCKTYPYFIHTISIFITYFRNIFRMSKDHILSWNLIFL